MGIEVLHGNYCPLSALEGLTRTSFGYQDSHFLHGKAEAIYYSFSDIPPEYNHYEVKVQAVTKKLTYIIKITREHAALKRGIF